MKIKQLHAIIATVIAASATLGWLIARVVWPVTMQGVLGFWWSMAIIALGVLALVLAGRYVVSRAMEASE